MADHGWGFIGKYEKIWALRYSPLFRLEFNRNLQMVIMVIFKENTRI